MEQFSLLAAAEQKAYELIRSDLESTLTSYRLDPEHLKLEKKKGYYSIVFDGKSVVARLGGIKKRYLSIPSTAIKQTDNFKEIVAEGKDGYTKLPLESFDQVKDHALLLQEVLQVIIERSGKEFDCCSRYLECSDARRCIHPDPQFGLKCGYRLVLKEGRIFYGKNRNVD